MNLSPLFRPGQPHTPTREATDGVENTYHVTSLYDKGESSYSNAVTGTRGLNTGIDTIEDVTDHGDGNSTVFRAYASPFPQKEM